VRATALGFPMPSEPRTGAFLRALCAGKPGGNLLELGMGTGLVTAWMLDGRTAPVTFDPQLCVLLSLISRRIRPGPAVPNSCDGSRSSFCPYAPTAAAKPPCYQFSTKIDRHFIVRMSLACFVLAISAFAASTWAANIGLPVPDVCDSSTTAWPFAPMYVGCRGLAI
jgi:hypothetical protein